jgi:hypothetical protein
MRGGSGTGWPHPAAGAARRTGALAAPGVGLARQRDADLRPRRVPPEGGGQGTGADPDQGLQELSP